MRACHAAAPGSIPSWDKFPGRGVSGFFLNCKTNVGKFYAHKYPEYDLAVIIILSYTSYYNEWVREWCGSSFMFVLPRRWPRH